MNVNIKCDMNLSKENEDCIKFLEKLINDMYKYFDFNIDLNVSIIDVLPNNSDDYQIFAYVNFDDDLINLNIDKVVFDMFNGNYYFQIEGSIYHEMIHLQDYINIKKCFNFVISSYEWNTEEELLVNIGYEFWTEVLAYAETFSIYKDFFNYPTEKQLARKLTKLLMYERNLNIVKEQMSDVVNVLNRIKRIIYLYAKHIGGCLCGNNKYYVYCDKTKNSDEYKYMKKVKTGLYKHIYKIGNNTYNKYLKKKLYNLGKYIFIKFYNFVNLDVYKFEESVAIAYYF